MARKTVLEILKEGSVAGQPKRDKKVSFVLTQSELDSLNRVCKDFGKNKAILIVEALREEGLLTYAPKDKPEAH